MRAAGIVSLIGLGLALAACQPHDKYYWGSYSNSLYDYYGNPGDEPEYEKSLAAIVAAGDTGKKVPPGIYAEYGYMMLAHGDTAQAIQLFQREKQSWPEAAAFMDKEIAAAKGPNQPQKADKPASGGGEKLPPSS